MDSKAEYAQWLGVLDDMERNLQRQATDTGWIEARQEDWQPPELIGPIPAELTGRAQHVLARQRETIGRLEHTQEQVLRHRDAVAQVPGQGPAGPTYLDAAG